MLKLFGDEAEDTNGDFFRAVVRSVEGRRVVELYPICKVCEQTYHPSEGRRGVCFECREREEQVDH